MWTRVWGNWNFYTSPWSAGWVAHHLENRLAISCEAQCSPVRWPRHPAPRHLPKKNDNVVHRKTCLGMSLAALFIMARSGKQPQMPTNTWSILLRGDAWVV